MKHKDLFLKLYQAQNETDLQAVIDSNPLFQDQSNWHPLGGNENNFATIENQQASAIGALIEKFTNSIDAILMRRCYEMGIDPKSPEAPKTMQEAIERFYGEKYQWLSREFIKEQASNIQVIADGTTKLKHARTYDTSLTIYDDGEGQHPEDFESTFLSIGKGNKNDILFVQGKYNMGGTGAIVFCGKNRYQLIASRRYDGSGEFGFTLIRKHPFSEEDKKTKKNTWYEYLKIDGKIPSFPIDTLELGLHEKEFKTGSIIIEQDAEKSTNVNTSLVIKPGGSLLIDNNMDPNSSFSLSLGSNTYTTFEEGSTIELDATQTGTVKPIILKQGASLLDMSTGEKPGVFEYSFMQNVPELFSIPFNSMNSSSLTTNASMSLWDENASTWSVLSAATDFVAMEGFKVEYPSMNYNAGLSGILNSGSISKTLDYNAKSIAGEAGWNLTGNPYPSAIVWDSVSTDNISAAVYTYNEQTKQYNVYMKGGLSLNGAVPYLPVGKAFFVRANDANGTFQLTNAARSHYDFSTPLKATPNDYLKLAVEGNSYSDETIIRFLPDATDDYDSQLDAFKLLAEDDAVPQIYSVLQSDESMMAINTLLPPGDKGITVPLNFKATVPGTYKISVKDLNFDASVSVVLKDLKNNTTQDLRTNPDYTFDFVSGDPENRFEIQFGAGITGIEHQLTESLELDIFATGNIVNIKTFDDKDYRYEVYDIKGKIIKQDKLYNKGLNTVVINVRQGVYIIKVISNNQSVSKKIAILK
ncbi:MAG: T9SS type A sorting domain-containing protein [Bacteroidales bacterium]|nr:T9SS type A sorting domain-containing protein [Bacteroidales bacterium]